MKPKILRNYLADDVHQEWFVFCPDYRTVIFAASLVEAVNKALRWINESEFCEMYRKRTA